MYNDTVSDFITQIRNASAAHKEKIRVRSSKVVSELAGHFKKSGFIAAYEVDGRYLTITMEAATPVTHIRRLSKPGLRHYVRSTNIPSPHSGLGLVLLSTPKGVLTGHQAKKQNVGGELICEVW